MVYCTRPGSRNDRGAAAARLGGAGQRARHADVSGARTVFADQPAIQSLPPPTPNSVVFIEEYRTPQAFPQHVKGPVFRTFVEKNGSLFVNSDGKPFTTVPFLTRIAGFIRRGAGASPWFRPRHRPSHHYPRIPNAPTRSVGLIGKFQISLAN